MRIFKRLHFFIHVISQYIGLKSFCLFRIKENRIFFEAFGGSQISCNPYYIYMGMLQTHEDCEMVWSYIKTGKVDGFQCVKANSILYYYYLLTSHVVITNVGFPYNVPFRKKQTIINTWHGGGAYKRVGYDVGKKKSNRVNSFFDRKRKEYTNYFYLASCKKFAEVNTNSFCVSEDRFLSVGMPRNDVFFDETLIENFNVKVREKLGLKEHEFVILYAPTYRSPHECLRTGIDYSILVDSVKKRFQTDDVVILQRCHYHSDSVNEEEDTIGIKKINVARYPFMQELLCCADMLISDYSSCIWDYSFTYKPCLLFTPDLASYKCDINFYVPINSWGFHVASNNEELKNEVLSFNMEEYVERMEEHHRQYGSYETGNATDKVLEIIRNILQGKVKTACTG